jgi:hypothetical protein
MKYHIGDILVHNGEPDNSNPYRGQAIEGTERKEALTLFKNNLTLQKNYTFWYAPYCGGAKRVISPDEIEWGTSGLK